MFWARFVWGGRTSHSSSSQSFDHSSFTWKQKSADLVLVVMLALSRVVWYLVSLKKRVRALQDFHRSCEVLSEGLRGSCSMIIECERASLRMNVRELG